MATRILEGVFIWQLDWQIGLVNAAFAGLMGPAGDVLHEGPSFAYVVREIEATGIFQLLTQPCPIARFAPPEVKLVVSEHRCPFITLSSTPNGK